MGDRYHYAFTDRGMLVESGLDLAQLDAEASDLHLMIDAAEIVDRAVRQVAGKVAGAIQPRSGSVAERIANELLGGQFGAVQVSEPDVDASDIQLTRDTDGHGIHPHVEEVNLRVGDRPPDRNGAKRSLRVAFQKGAASRGLGGAVKMVRFGIHGSLEALGGIERKGFSLQM